MMSVHPGGRTLEQYRNHNLTDRKREAVESHLKGCWVCKRRLDRLNGLDRHLCGLPLEEPSEHFADRVMEGLASLEADAGPGNGHVLPPSGIRNRRAGILLRPELANAMVATAATYLFLSTGIVKVVYNLDPGAVELGLYEKVWAVLDWVNRLSQSLPS